MLKEPGGASELTGHELTRPLKHSSPEVHSSQRVELSVYLYPGLHVHALIELEPAGEVKLAGQATMRSEFPPGQYEPPVQTGQGLVPLLEPLPKYPGAHRHWFWEVESVGLRVLLGQRLFAPAMHQELVGHTEQMLPLRK